MSKKPLKVPKYHMTLDGKSIAFDTAEEAAAFLQQHPHLVPDFVEVWEQNARSFAFSWDAYRYMRETYNMIVDVLEALAKSEGKNAMYSEEESQ